MTIKAIETEADLIAALSEKGRFLEYTDGDDYVIRVSMDGSYNTSLRIPVDYDLGEKWTESHDETSPEYGPWCSTWVLPDFWPWPIETPDNSG
mgnify:CR=1 FL=1|jgi:hypothetical protein